MHGAGRTHAVKGSNDPIWRETLFLYVRDSETQSLTVHVEHAAREPENTNVLLGYTEIKDLKKLCDGEVHNLQLDLQGWVHACLHFASKAAAIPAGMPLSRDIPVLLLLADWPNVFAATLAGIMCRFWVFDALFRI